MSDLGFSLSTSDYKPLAQTISFFNLRGGVGKSTMATNLAVALAKIKSCEVGLIDLALDTLHCSLMLDLKPKAYLSGLSEFKVSELAAETVNEMLTIHPSGVKLLSAAENPKEAELVTPEVVDFSWQVLARKLPYIVIDAGSNFNEISLAAIDRSEKIFLVFSPDLASVKSTSEVIEILTEIGVPPNKIIGLVNWIFPENPLLLQRIKPILKVNLVAEIPFDSLSFGKSINTGRPIILENPDSNISKIIYSLAQFICSTE